MNQRSLLSDIVLKGRINALQCEDSVFFKVNDRLFNINVMVIKNTKNHQDHTLIMSVPAPHDIDAFTYSDVIFKFNKKTLKLEDDYVMGGRQWFIFKDTERLDVSGKFDLSFKLLK